MISAKSAEEPDALTADAALSKLAVAYAIIASFVTYALLVAEGVLTIKPA